MRRFRRVRRRVEIVRLRRFLWLIRRGFRVRVGWKEVSVMVFFIRLSWWVRGLVRG